MLSSDETATSFQLSELEGERMRIPSLCCFVMHYLSSGRLPVLLRKSTIDSIIDSGLKIEILNAGTSQKLPEYSTMLLLPSTGNKVPL